MGKTQGHMAMIGANISWGLMAPFSKFVILSGIVTPLIITNLRMAGAMILFWLTSIFMPNEHVPAKDLLRLFAASMLGVLINQSCFMFGVGLTSPGDASIITTSMPLWVMILSAFILKNPITPRKLLGIACGAGGALILIMGSGRVAAGASGTAIWGNLLVLTAQLSYALYLVLFKNFVRRYSLVTLMKWMFTFAFAASVPYSLPQWIETDWMSLGILHVGSLLFTVVMGTYVAYIFIMYGQKTLPPTVVGMYNYVQPIVSCLVAIYLGMDRFNAEKAFAIVLIFTGVWLVTRHKPAPRANADKQ